LNAHQGAVIRADESSTRRRRAVRDDRVEYRKVGPARHLKGRERLNCAIFAYELDVLERNVKAAFPSVAGKHSPPPHGPTFEAKGARVDWI
jgi:hypothetical protein